MIHLFYVRGIKRNSETIPYFWRTWNIPVHRWATRWVNSIDEISVIFVILVGIV